MPTQPDHVGPQDKSKKNTAISGSQPNPLIATAEDVCYWNDIKYTQGGRACFNHKVYRCQKSGIGNEWIPTGENC
jgi:hypothetical protein